MYKLVNEYKPEESMVVDSLEEARSVLKEKIQEVFAEITDDESKWDNEFIVYPKYKFDAIDTMNEEEVKEVFQNTLFYNVINSNMNSNSDFNRNSDKGDRQMELVYIDKLNELKEVFRDIRMMPNRFDRVSEIRNYLMEDMKEHLRVMEQQLEERYTEHLEQLYNRFIYLWNEVCRYVQNEYKEGLREAK